MYFLKVTAQYMRVLQIDFKPNHIYFLAREITSYDLCKHIPEFKIQYFKSLF